nr:RNA-directed DNA polymerase, eukaryota [Tanacetum cinerariifolium]
MDGNGLSAESIVVGSILGNGGVSGEEYLVKLVDQGGEDVHTAFLLSRQILDGSFVINELLSWCKHKKQHAMIFKVDFAKAYDSVRLDFLDDVLQSFGFGFKWRSWILGSLSSGMAPVLVNRSPTAEFQFHCGLKQDRQLHYDLSPFYADDAVFVGEWSDDNLSSIMHVLHCFSLASELEINVKKSYLLGVGIPNDLIVAVASTLGCSIMKTPFKYLGFTIGGNMSNISACDDIISKLNSRLSKWKVKTLFIRGRLTLLKSVLGSTPIYWMSLYKVPKSVLNSMEAIRRNFFNGAQDNDKKITWVKWAKMVWDLNGNGVFCVKDVRKLLEEYFLPKEATATRWVKFVPIKINVFEWKVSLDRLPTRVNLMHRGIYVSSLSCLICSSHTEDTSHLLFSCTMVADVTRLVCHWWDLVWSPLGSYSEWLLWFNSIRLGSNLMSILEGVFFVTWWCLWNFENRLLFAAQKFRKDEVSNDINPTKESFISLVGMLIAGLKEKEGSSDGIYRAIDIRLNRQRDVTKSEREEICAVLDCNKMFVFVLLAVDVF